MHRSNTRADSPVPSMANTGKVHIQLYVGDEVSLSCSPGFTLGKPHTGDYLNGNFKASVAAVRDLILISEHGNLFS